METDVRNKYQTDLNKSVESNYVDSERECEVFYRRSIYISTNDIVRDRPYIELPKLASKNLPFQINDDTIELPNELKLIAEQIEEAKDILQYSFDWDEEGAIAADSETFGKATSFVKNYALYLYRTYSVVLTPPYIELLRDGSVSVHWENTKSQFLIIFKKGNNKLAYYYAEQKDKKIPFKSAIEIGKTEDKFLALWMKTYLT